MECVRWSNGQVVELIGLDELPVVELTGADCICNQLPNFANIKIYNCNMCI